MAELYANCTVSHKMHSDRRFDLLAELGGWTRNDACFRMVQLWARCTALKTDRPPAEEIRIHLGLRGEQLLLDAVLGERQQDGSIRVVGGGLTGGDTDRFGWYEPIEQRNVSGGLARADQVRRTGRGAGGRFAPAGSSDRQRPDQQPSSVTSGSPASASDPPASGFRISEEDQNSLPRTIPGVVPEPDATPPPPPPPAASQSIPSIPPGESAWHRRQRWWGAMLDADQRIRAAGIEPNAPALPKAPAGANETNMNRCERQLIDGGATPVEVDVKMRHIVLVAEAEALRSDNRSRKWFKPALIWDPERSARAVDTSLAEAGRSRAPAHRRGDPSPSAPAPARPERPAPDPVRSAEEMAAMRAMAALAASTPELGREISALPTPELNRMFGDGQRAPPASAGPDDFPERKPKSRKVSTT